MHLPAAINYGKIAEAERCYGKVLEADSLNFYANNQLARLYYQLGDYGESDGLLSYIGFV